MTNQQEQCSSVNEWARGNGRDARGSLSPGHCWGSLHWGNQIPVPALSSGPNPVCAFPEAEKCLTPVECQLSHPHAFAITSAWPDSITSRCSFYHCSKDKILTCSQGSNVRQFPSPHPAHWQDLIPYFIFKTLFLASALFLWLC